MITLAGHPAFAEEKQSTELFKQKIEAGLVYNFLKYTTWPTGTSQEGKLHVCLFGHDSFDGYLNPLRGRTAQQRVISVNVVKDLQNLSDCQLLYIPEDQEEMLPDILASIGKKGILTVSDIDDFTDNGGMVGFSTSGQRMRLLINNNMIASSGLRIEDRLLRLSESGAAE